MTAHESIDSKGARRVLFVHQGAELYGSDRTFEQSVRGFRRAEPESHITVLLASRGPLVAILQSSADEIIFAPLFVLRKQQLKTGALFNLPSLIHAIRKAMGVVAQYDLVYINTAVIIDYILACRFRRIPTILHVHELPVGLSRTLLRMIVGLSGAYIIFNSQATRRAFGTSEDRRHRVIPNGTVIPAYVPLQVEDTLHILMIGRFNSWKGQGLLVAALARLDKQLLKRVRVVIAGGVYQEQHYFKNDVILQAKRLDLQETIDFHDFVKDPSELYRWSTVVVVPSLLPEPFGLVAIEAMAHGRPVIAAEHGGLVDIVVDGETGIRFTPGDPEDLASAIRTYLAEPALVVMHGVEGRKRYCQYFHEDRYMTAISEAINIVADV